MNDATSFRFETYRNESDRPLTPCPRVLLSCQDNPSIASMATISPETTIAAEASRRLGSMVDSPKTAGPGDNPAVAASMAAISPGKTIAAEASRRLDSIVASPKTAFELRESINDILANPSNDKFGAETRSIARYQHPDQVRRNMCPYWNASFVLNYTMEAYQVSTNNSFIEITATTQFEDIYSSPNTEGTHLLTVKRPTVPPGYFSVGDVAFTVTDVQSALLIKATEGDILMEPVDYNLVWENSGDNEASGEASSWEPIPPDGFKCLGHVWVAGYEKPPTDLIRCVQQRFVTTVGSTWKWDSRGSNATFLGSLWGVVTTESTVSAGTFVVERSLERPGEESFLALKKQCILGYGQMPFCAVESSDMYSIESLDAKQFELPYAKLLPCGYNDEDKSTYGLTNDDDHWEDFAIEVHQNGPDRVAAYKHLGASKKLGKDYCLGSTMFGTSNFQVDLFLHSLVQVGFSSPEEVSNQAGGKYGNNLSDLVGGSDIVLLFPCDGTNEVKDYQTALEEVVAEANTLGETFNGVVNINEHFGEVATFGDPKWSNPHYCGFQEEPTDSGECRKVEPCFFEDGGCKFYDQSPCEEDDMCWSNYCSSIDKVCGKVCISVHSPSVCLSWLSAAH